MLNIKNDIESFSAGEEDVRVVDRLQELQDRSFPVLSSVDLFDAMGEDSEAFKKRADDYLKIFAKTETSHCLCCGASLGGLFGKFEYGLAHGEGRCSNCGYPCRAIHYIKDEDGKTLIRFETILQYHPSGLSIR